MAQLSLLRQTIQSGPALCLINWDKAASMVDDSSYENWIEGTRVLDAAILALPIDVTYVTTGIFSSTGLSPSEAAQALEKKGAKQIFCAGNAIEHDVIDFALHLLAHGLESTLLFDVCGTRDPIAKWRALAAAVDRGVRVSTVQQSLPFMALDTGDGTIRSRIADILNADLGEHVLELSAA